MLSYASSDLGSERRTLQRLVHAYSTLAKVGSTLRLLPAFAFRLSPSSISRPASFPAVPPASSFPHHLTSGPSTTASLTASLPSLACQSAHPAGGGPAAAALSSSAEATDTGASRESRDHLLSISALGTEPSTSEPTIAPRQCASLRLSKINRASFEEVTPLNSSYAFPPFGPPHSGCLRFLYVHCVDPACTGQP